MSEDRKSAYRGFLLSNDSLPVYIQDWYLDLVCGRDNWSVVFVEKNGKIIAALPYYVKSKSGFHWIGMPKLSKMHGPYIIDEYRTNKHHHAIVDELLDQLPDVAFYQQSLGYEFNNWLPYLWRDYSQVTLYSYIFDHIDIEAIWSNMDADCRRRIRNSEGRLFLKEGLPMDKFYSLLSKTYERQRLRNPFEYEFLTKYYNEIRLQGRGNILYVVNSFDQVQCAAMVIWDKVSSYYILEGSDPMSNDRNAMIFLKWSAIQFTKSVLLLDRFDFEGSISRRIEKIYREFGAKAQPYYVIKKYHSKTFLFIKLIQNIRQYGKLAQW